MKFKNLDDFTYSELLEEFESIIYNAKDVLDMLYNKSVEEKKDLRKDLSDKGLLKTYEIINKEIEIY